MHIHRLYIYSYNLELTYTLVQNAAAETIPKGLLGGRRQRSTVRTSIRRPHWRGILLRCRRKLQPEKYT